MPFNDYRPERFRQRASISRTRNAPFLPAPRHRDAHPRCRLGNRDADECKARRRIGEFRVGKPFRNRECDCADDLVVRDGSEQAVKIIVRGDRPLVRLQGGAESERRSGVIGRRIVVGERAADGAAIAHMRVADALRDLR
jgi:hypothetical protein